MEYEQRDDIIAHLVGENIRKARERRGWSQYDLAHRARVGHGTVDNVEKGTGGLLRTVGRFGVLLSPDKILPTEDDVIEEAMKWPWNPAGNR